jgi:hypothetical protein
LARRAKLGLAKAADRTLSTVINNRAEVAKKEPDCVKNQILASFGAAGF